MSKCSIQETVRAQWVLLRLYLYQTAVFPLPPNPRTKTVLQTRPKSGTNKSAHQSGPVQTTLNEKKLIHFVMVWSGLDPSALAGVRSKPRCNGGSSRGDHPSCVCRWLGHLQCTLRKIHRLNEEWEKIWNYWLNMVLSYEMFQWHFLIFLRCFHT